ncbi:hypothetical protein KEM54_006775 [Ascosphaera aggregata]|nr:hypothetical protein KEM54_006775 [Ascosphaera aggregata]
MSRIPTGGRSSRPDLVTNDGLSLHRASTETRSNPDIFSDDYAIDETHDRGNARTDNEAFRHGAEFATSNTISVESPFDDSLALVPINMQSHFNQSSRQSVDSLETIHTHQRNDLTSTIRVPPSPSIAPSESQRSISTASRFSVPHVMSPYMGPSGPSHAYSMYPQDVGLARMNSTSTTSTTRPIDRASIRATAPQHPYLMYPQNTVPEDILEHNPVIPVGFPGRQMVCPPAPNEVGDIVGPDGHTETLPPYSRYAPEEYKGQTSSDDNSSNHGPIGAEAISSLPAIPPPVVHAPLSGLAATQTASTDGTIAGGAASSGETSQNPLVIEHVLPAGVAVASTAGVAEMSTSEADPSGNFKEAGFRDKLKDVGQRKVCCGVPIFMVVVVSIVLLLSTATGGVIGGILGNRKGVAQAASHNATPSTSASPTSSIYVTVTTTLIDSLDASPVSNVPAGLPSLIPGSYLIHINEPKQAASCLDKNFDNAWQCCEDVTIPVSVGDDEYSGDSTIGFDSPHITAKFNYGPQYPIFKQQDHNLTMGIELNRPDLGPGLYFETEMDKLVIIPASVFPPSDDSRRTLSYRDVFRRSPDWVGQRSRAGDKPWFCWWNSTIFEVFIFLNETATTNTVFGTGTPAATTSTNIPFMAMATTSTLLWSPTTMKTRRLVERGHDQFLQGGDDVSDQFLSQFRRTSLPSLFNYPIRMIERGRKDMTSPYSAPYCEQMQVMDNGELATLGNSMQLVNSPTPSSRSLLRRRSSGIIYGRQSDDGSSRSSVNSDCYCEWFSG